MINDVLQSIPGVEIYAIIALILAMLVFIGMTIRVFWLKRGEIERIKRLPLEPDTPDRYATEERNAGRER